MGKFGIKDHVFLNLSFTEHMIDVLNLLISVLDQVGLTLVLKFLVGGA